MRKSAPLVQSGDKYCFCCSTIKATSEFYRNRSTRDGFTSQCKPCVRETQAQSRLIKLRVQATAEFIAARHSGGMIELPAAIDELAGLIGAAV